MIGMKGREGRIVALYDDGQMDGWNEWSILFPLFRLLAFPYFLLPLFFIIIFSRDNCPSYVGFMSRRMAFGVGALHICLFFVLL